MQKPLTEGAVVVAVVAAASSPAAAAAAIHLACVLMLIFAQQNLHLLLDTAPFLHRLAAACSIWLCVVVFIESTSHT